MKILSNLLSILFPPVLPGRIRDWEQRVEEAFEEQGSAGPARPKRYRNGIDRYFAENKLASYQSNNRQYQTQLRHAREEIVATERDLIAQGYTNTMHDCWEKVE